MQYVKATASRVKLFWHQPRVLSSWTLTSRVVVVGVVLSILQNIIYGFYPCRFNLKRKKFVFDKLLAIYCLAVSTVFGVFYVSRMWQDFKGGRIDQRNPIQIYCYMKVCVCLLNYITQWSMVPRILRFQNSFPFFRTINFLSISLKSIGGAIFLNCLKSICCPFLMQLALLLYEKHKNPQHTWMRASQIMIPILLGNQLNNCFFGGIVIAKFVRVEINSQLCRILVEVNRLQTPLEMQLHKPFYRMQRFCDLADRLDELRSKYTQSTASSIGYMELTAVSLVVSMANYLIITTLGFYTQYQAIADYIMLEEPYDVARALVHFVFIVVPFTEVYLVTRVSQQIIDEAKKTGNLLQQMNLEHADIRFKQAVDAFWLEVSLMKYKFMPLGLLELDGSLINMTFSTVAGFMLFLIQNDLMLRYSLK